jgi:ribonuclease HII
MLAMKRAIEQLTTAPEVVWIDGNQCPALDYPSRAIVDGDRLVAAIAAASILAKTTRDAMLVDLDRSYPLYGFARHKGYSTPEHLAALALHGPCAAHRRWFGPVRQTGFAF